MVLQPELAIGIIVGRFVLQPVGSDGTRLVFRESTATQGPGAEGPAWVQIPVWHPAHFVMVHRVLEGIKERAEGRSLVPDALQLIARIGWVLAGAGLLAEKFANVVDSCGLRIARRSAGLVRLRSLDLVHRLTLTNSGHYGIGQTIPGVELPVHCASRNVNDVAWGALDYLCTI